MSHRLLLLLTVVGLGLAGLTGCATTSNQGPGEATGAFLDDAAITTAVKAIILADADAHLLKIQVTTTGGQVLLEGSVHSRAAEGRLIAKIKEMHSVRSVRSELRLEPPRPS